MGTITKAASRMAAYRQPGKVAGYYGCQSAPSSGEWAEKPRHCRPPRSRPAAAQNLTGTTGALPSLISFGISLEAFSHTSSIERLGEKP
jgi:hypothetical protein